MRLINPIYYGMAEHAQVVTIVAWDSEVDLMLKFLFQVPRRLTVAGIPFLLYPMTYAQ